MKKKLLIAVGVIIGISIIIAATSGDSSTTEPSNAATGDSIESLVTTELGSCNREGIDKVAKIDIAEAGYGANVDVYFAINDNLSEDFIKGGARLDVLNVMETLYTSGYDIQWVDMYGTFAMRDDYGNVEEIEVIHARLGRDTATKINWENITKEDLFSILDFKQIHPAFK